MGSSFSAAFRCCSARRISHVNRWNRVPTVAAKIDDAGRAGLRGRRREEEKARVPSSFSHEAELSKHQHRIVRFERVYSRFRGSCSPGKLVSRHEHAFSRPPTRNVRKNEGLTNDTRESSESRRLRISASPPHEAVKSLCRAVRALISQTPLTEGSQGPPRTTFGQPRRTSRVPRQTNGEQR